MSNLSQDRPSGSAVMEPPSVHGHGATRELGANDRNVSRSRRAHEHDLWALNEIDLWAGNMLTALVASSF